MDQDEMFDALHSFASIAKELAGSAEPATATQRIVELAVKVVGCQVALLAEAHGDRVRIVAASDPQLAKSVTAIIEETHDGVTVEALRSRSTVVCDDLQVETRWAPAVEQARAETSVRSVLAFYLELDGEPVGVLTLASDRPGYFTERLVQLASVYADHATIAMIVAKEHQQINNLQVALESSREIGAALGILMHQYDIDADAAFNALRMASQHANEKLRDVAAQVVLDRDAGIVERTIRRGRRRTVYSPPSAVSAADVAPDTAPDEPARG